MLGKNCQLTAKFRSDVLAELIFQEKNLHSGNGINWLGCLRLANLQVNHAPKYLFNSANWSLKILATIGIPKDESFWYAAHDEYIYIYMPLSTIAAHDPVLSYYVQRIQTSSFRGKRGRVMRTKWDWPSLESFSWIPSYTYANESVLLRFG